MAQRGRKSAASDMVAAPLAPIPPLDPGEKLDKESQELWDTMVASQHEGFFCVEHRQLLLGLVHHTIAFKRLYRKIRVITDAQLDTEAGLTKFNRLRHAIQVETKLMLDFQRQLRLTHQSRYQPDASILKKKPMGTLTPFPAGDAHPKKLPTPGGKKHPAEGPVSKTTGKSNPWDH